MNRTLKGAVIAALAVTGVLGSAAAAHAEAAPTTYVTVAWELGPLSTSSAPFADTQHIVAHVAQTTLDLHALDGTLPCGHTYQVDGYVAGSVTDTLIAGGILTGPSKPNAEALAYGAPGLEGNPWRYVTTDACPPPSVTFPTSSYTCNSYTLPDPVENTKYVLNADGSRPVGGTFPLAVGETVGPFVLHTLASANVQQGSVTFGPFTGTACSTPKPTPTPTTVACTGSTCLAFTGTSAALVRQENTEAVLGVGIAVAGIGLSLLGMGLKRRREVSK